MPTLETQGYFISPIAVKNANTPNKQTNNQVFKATVVKFSCKDYTLGLLFLNFRELKT